MAEALADRIPVASGNPSKLQLPEPRRTPHKPADHGRSPRRGFHLPQGFPLVPCLPAGLLPRRLAQTFHPSFLLEPIARWGLPTVRTVQPQPTLKLFHTSQQGINQRVFLVAGQLAKVGPLSHSQLESHFPLFGNPYNHTRCWGVTKNELSVRLTLKKSWQILRI